MFHHTTVLLDETINSLLLDSVHSKDAIYIDGTLGGGGHSEAILTKNRNIKLIGIDRDNSAISAARDRLDKFGDRFQAVKGNFKDVSEICKNLNIKNINGMVLDLGVSSHQLDTADRGFSYQHNSKLDMRMDSNDNLSAYEVVNTYEQDKLAQVIKEYGEERWAKRIAQFIVERRAEKLIETTFELVDTIKAAVPLGARKDGPHPAKRTFQAIRIEVNGELEILNNTINDICELLSRGGRLSIITFHSLEDRIVKRAFQKLEKACTCPVEFPVCVCGNMPKAKIITKKPILPSDEEIENNPRSRSAKLRVIERI